MTVQNDIQHKMNMAAVNGARAINPGPASGARAPAIINTTDGARKDFSAIFSEASDRNKAAGIKISKHAELRLSQRNISLTGAQKGKIADALAKAESKGVKDALVMIDGFAVVANARSKTIITAANAEDLKSNIFTNIDGALFA